MKQIYVESYYRSGYSRFMQFINNILNHPKQKSIEQRLKIIEFCDEFGFEATKIAFHKSRSTIYLWKQKLASGGGKLSALAPGDKAPHHKRRRVVAPYVESFIIGYRTNHPGVDKTAITPVLRAACEKAGIKPLSESTVGRIIHDLKARGRLPRATRVRINAGTGKLHAWEPRSPAKKNRRKGFQPSLPGDLVEIDTVNIFADGVKRYLITAIDLPTRFAFAYTYKSSSSACARDFLGKLKSVAPFKITRVQTDNGHEFLKYFAKSCEDDGLTHFFNYPKHPQSNGHLERFNRTIQEQFAYWNTDSLDEPDIFNRLLMKYLLWYNLV
jgi:putative transposase